MFLAKFTVFFGLQALSMFLFILSCSVVTILTVSAFQGNNLSHLLPPPRLAIGVTLTTLSYSLGDVNNFLSMCL